MKVRGHRVDLSEVERATLSVPGVDKGIVLCYHPGQEDQAILAFVTLKNGQRMTEMQIENDLVDRIPAYMLPQVKNYVLSNFSFPYSLLYLIFKI